MKKALITSAVLCGASAAGYLLSLRGRTCHPLLQDLQGWGYAHRGLHSEGIPENSMAAFRAALDHGYGIELDIHLMKDGNLAVIHDSSLKRTAGCDVRIEDLTAEDLNNYRLEGTGEKIPLFREVLELYSGKAPLIVELKPVGSNHAALCQAACDLLATYQGAYCMESFDPRCVRWLKKNRPHILRGQLSENFFGKKNGMNPAIAFLLTHNLLNFMSCPDFVAYKYADRKDTLSNPLCRKVWDLQGVSWTIKTQEEYDQAVKEGWLPIFEGFLP